MAGRLQDNIPNKILGERAITHQQLLERLQLLCGGHFAEQQQVDNLLKAEAVVLHNAVDDIVDIEAAIGEHAVTGHQLTVHQLVLLDGGDVCQTRQNTLTVNIAQTALHVVFAV